MRYPGGKGRSYPHIINLIPPHTTYVETHLGGGAVLRRKLASRRQIGIDCDPKVIGMWCEAGWDAHCELVVGDAVEWLNRNALEATACIYADPPYLPSTRLRKRVYRYDYMEEDHVRLLSVLREQRCSVIVSGYRNPIYDDLLAGWSTHSFSAATHTGLREETVWFNFQTPNRLHDCTHLGKGFREREAIRRKRSRLEQRIARLTLSEQYGLYDWLGGRLKGAGN